MNFKFKQWLVVSLLTAVVSANSWAAPGPGPQGLVTCSISSPVIQYTTSYVFGGANATSLSVPISCVQTLYTSANATAVLVTVNIGNSDSAPGTTQNTATQINVPSILYDFYTSSGCTAITETHGAVNPPLAVTITIDKTTRTGSGTAVFWGCVPAPSSLASGLYTDTASATIPPGGVVSSTGSPDVAIGTSSASISVRITIPERCVITMPAGALSFSYTSFAGTDSTPNKTFQVQCGIGLTSPVPTMALTDVNGIALTSGTAAGLSYTLALSASSTTGGTSTLSVKQPGGGDVTYNINGNMVAGQAGSCAAPAIQSGSTCTQTITGVHYVTVSW